MPIVVQPETGIPFPFDTQPEEIGQWRDRAKAAVETLKEIIEVGGEITITEDDRNKARAALASDKPLKITEQNAGALVHLEAILSEYDKDILNVNARLRTFVTNKLIMETVDEDAKVRLKALELLGKSAGVGLFNDKLEINVTHRTVEEIDNELEGILDKYLGPVEEVKTKTEDEVNSLLSMSDEDLGLPAPEEIIKDDEEDGTES